MSKRRTKVTRAQPKMIECDEHGSTPGCLICRHLGDGRGLGYWAIQADAAGPAQAWCIACDALLDWDRGWSDRASALADWQIYCTICYDKTLKRHEFLGWCSEERPKRKRIGKGKRK